MELIDILGIDLNDPLTIAALDMEEDRQNVMRELAEIRKAKGLTVTEVAKEMQVRHQAVSKLEASKDPHLSTLARYALAIGVKIRINVEEVALKPTTRSTFVRLDGVSPHKQVTLPTSKGFDESIAYSTERPYKRTIEV